VMASARRCLVFDVLIGRRPLWCVVGVRWISGRDLWQQGGHGRREGGVQGGRTGAGPEAKLSLLRNVSQGTSTHQHGPYQPLLRQLLTLTTLCSRSIWTRTHADEGQRGRGLQHGTTPTRVPLRGLLSA
jgi:hypothetical protein